MIDHLTIHIGHPKTGTTSLQETFRKCAELLAEHGLYYYRGAHSYHALARAMNGEAGDQKAREEILESIARSRLPLGLVSSENYIRLSDGEVAAAIADFRKVAKRVSVLVYVRHPVSYASSTINQGVRRGRLLADCISAPRILPLTQLIERWRDAVGPKNIVVRPFDRSQLVGGDIIDDALQVLGVPELGPKLSRVRVNEAMSTMGVYLLDRANILAGGRVPVDVMRIFEQIEGPKFVLSEVAQEVVRLDAAPHLEFLKREYGIVLSEPNETPSEPVRLPEETLVSLARLVAASGVRARKTERGREREKAGVTRFLKTARRDEQRARRGDDETHG